MPSPDAAVGIRFQLIGMDDTLAQLGQLQNALGGLGIIPANGFNPALNQPTGAAAGPPTGPASPWALSAGYGGPIPTPPHPAGAAPGPYGGAGAPSQQGGLGTGLSLSVASLAIANVQTLTVQSAVEVVIHAQRIEGSSGGAAGVTAALGDAGAIAQGVAAAVQQAVGTAPNVVHPQDPGLANAVLTPVAPLTAPSPAAAAPPPPPAPPPAPVAPPAPPKAPGPQPIFGPDANGQLNLFRAATRPAPAGSLFTDDEVSGGGYTDPFGDAAAAKSAQQAAQARHQAQLARLTTPEGPGSAAGLSRYLSQMRRGETDTDFTTWQQEQFQKFAAAGGKGDFTSYLETGIPGRQVADPFAEMVQLQRLQLGFHAAQSVGQAGVSLGMAATGLSSEDRIGGGMQAAGSGLMGLAMLMGMLPGGQVPGAITAGVAGVGALLGIGGGAVQASGSTAGREGTLLLQNTRGLEGWNSTNYGIGGGRFNVATMRWEANDPNAMYTRARESGMGVQEFLTIRGAMTRLVDNAGSTALDARVAQFQGMRPEEAQFHGDVIARVEALALQGGRAGALGRVRSGRGLSAGDLEQEMQVAALNGDLDTLSTLEAYLNNPDFQQREPGAAGRLRGLLAANRNAAAGSIQFSFERRGFQQDRQQAGLEQQVAQGTLQGGRALAPLLQRESAAAQGEMGRIDAQIAQITSQPGWERNPAVLDQVRRLTVERNQLAVTVQTAPFRVEAGLHESALSHAGSTQRMGQAALGELQAFGVAPGARMNEAFGQIRSGMDARITATRDHVEFLRRNGAGPEAIAEAEATLKELEAQRRTQPLTEIETRYAASSRIGGAMSLGAQAALGVVQATQFSGAETGRLHAAVRSGLEVQLRAAEHALSELRNTPGVDRGLIEESKARVAGIKAQLAQSVLQEAQQAAQDAFQQAGAGGRLAAPGIGAALSLGLTPTAAQQSAESAGVEAEARTAGQNAAAAEARGDQRAAMQWREMEAQKRAQLQTLPYQQLQQRYAADEQRVGSAQSIAGANLTLDRLEGRGGADTVENQRAAVTAAQGAVELQRGKLREMELTLPAGSALLDAQRAAVRQAEVGAAQARLGLSDVAMPVELRERLSQGQFEINILKNTPGAYGNVRGALQRQMGSVNEEIGVLEERLRTDGATMGPEGQFRLREQIRSLQMQRFGLFNELGQGWENNLMSQAINSPGNFGFVANVLGSNLQAVTHGIVNPHLGSRNFALADWVGAGAKFATPANLPGWRGAMHSDGPTGVMGPGGNLKSPMMTAPGAGLGGNGSTGGGGGSVITVQLQWPDGSHAGQFQVNGAGNAGGTVAQGMAGGEVKELLQHLGVSTPRQDN